MKRSRHGGYVNVLVVETRFKSNLKLIKSI